MKIEMTDFDTHWNRLLMS